MILFKELFDDVKSALILKGVLSPMNSMFKLNFQYDIEMNEADFGAPLTMRLTWAVFFYIYTNLIPYFFCIFLGCIR